MIASLRGVLAELGAGVCVVEAGGVGYLLSISSHTAQSLPERGREVFLRTRQVVREDGVFLFGFAEADELEFFDLLISVSGVGPRLALTMLSGLRPAALARALREEQIGVLVAVPGIGRKTAERLIVELRDKLESPLGAAKESGVLPRSERYLDAVAALTGLGYTASQAQEAIRVVMDEAGEASLEDILRRALAKIGKAALARR